MREGPEAAGVFLLEPQERAWSGGCGKARVRWPRAQDPTTNTPMRAGPLGTDGSPNRCSGGFVRPTTHLSPNRWV